MDSEEAHWHPSMRPSRTYPSAEPRDQIEDEVSTPPSDANTPPPPSSTQHGSVENSTLDQAQLMHSTLSEDFQEKLVLEPSQPATDEAVAPAGQHGPVRDEPIESTFTSEVAETAPVAPVLESHSTQSLHDQQTSLETDSPDATPAARQPLQAPILGETETPENVQDVQELSKHSHSGADVPEFPSETLPSVTAPKTDTPPSTGISTNTTKKVPTLDTTTTEVLASDEEAPSTTTVLPVESEPSISQEVDTASTAAATAPTVQAESTETREGIFSFSALISN